MQAKYTEAEAALQEAIDKDPNNPETLVNMIVMSQHTGKQPEVGYQYSAFKSLALGQIICNLMLNIYVTGEQQISQPIEGLRPSTHIRGKVGPEGSRL